MHVYTVHRFLHNFFHKVFTRCTIKIKETTGVLLNASVGDLLETRNGTQGETLK